MTREPGPGDLSRETPIPQINPPAGYAFAGEVRFRLAVEMLGVTSVRHARVLYWCTPPWEYCDARGVLRRSGAVSALQLQVRPCLHGLRRSADGEQRCVVEELDWEVSDLFSPGHLDDEAFNMAERLVEEQVQQEDAIRRQAFGLPSGAYPPYERGVPVIDG